MNGKILKNNVKCYLAVFLCGLLVGIATRLTDFLEAGTLWSFSSVATLFGFWIISVTVIVLLSSSSLCAGVSSFLYMFGMTFSFYTSPLVLARYFPALFQEEFKTSLFLLYTFLSAGCGLGASLLRCWERKTKLNAILYAIPVGALLAEAIGTAICLATRSLFLFQFLLDFSSAAAFGILFFKRAESKSLYFASMLLVTAAVYFLLYHPFLHLV